MLIVAAVLCALAACSSYEPTDSDGAHLSDATLWVAKDVVVGQQCRTDNAEPLSPADELAAVGVTAQAEAVERRPVCEACSCPAYSAVHYAQVDAADVARAARAGYAASDPPSTH